MTRWIVTREGRSWAVTREGAERAQGLYGDQETALARAKAAAERSAPAQIVLRDENGHLI